jgi:hypothetical protein
MLNREENRCEAADILRSLVERIELRRNQQGKLEVDLSLPLPPLSPTR